MASLIRIVVSAFVCFLSIYLYLLARSPKWPPASPFQRSVISKAPDIPANAPYGPSWGSWWHPQRPISLAGDGKSIGTHGHGQGGGAIGKNWNILYHLGGNGPWVEKIDDVVEGGIGPPEGCEVEQVHMMSRHAERYPTVGAGKKMLDLIQRIKSANTTLQGDLSFVDNWTFFTSDPEAHLENLTTTGPFAGTLGAFTTGVRLRTRYSHLLPSLSPGNKTSFWSCDCPRVVDTARYFAAGFFGLDYSATASHIIIPESASRGADTLTPGRSCVAYRADALHGHAYGLRMLVKFGATYLPAIAKRLQGLAPGLAFSDVDVFTMQELCGFETTVRGSSPWCDVFSHDEWLSFEYARDVVHYYRTGPGNPWGRVLGGLWLNATAELLRKGGAEAGRFFASFVHDGDVVPMVAALGLFDEERDLPVDRREGSRRTRYSQVVPMGGRVIFERLSCRRKDDEDGDVFVRVNINDGIVAIPGCDSGPGSSCPLEGFLRRVRVRGEGAGVFRQKCGLASDVPGKITFLHQ